MNWHARDPQDVLAELDSSSQGLSQAEVARRRERFGENRLPVVRHAWWRMLLRQFADLFVLVLLAALALSVAMPFFEHAQPSARDFVDAYVIAGILLANAGLGFVQEYRAENAIAELERLASGRIGVRRPDGEGVRIESIDATLLVPGDVFVLEAGDRVAADGRLLEAAFLELDESAMTGESVPVGKGVAAQAEELPMADWGSMVHAGTLVTRGSGVAVATDTGARTQMGRIAHMMVAAERAETPLERQLARLGRLLAGVVLVLCVFVLVLGWLKGLPFLETALVGVSLAVSAVPEGLPAVVTVCFALGVRRMAGERALVRRLESLETLGAVTVIATDKTGTLTENRMKVVESWVGVEGEADLLAEIGYACNHAPGPDQGEPTEAALVGFAIQRGVNRAPIDEELVPFTSAQKYMATRHGARQFFKGAPERIEDAVGSTCPAMHEAAKGFAQRGLRVLAGAIVDEQGPRIVGLWGLEDPPRAGVSEAIQAARRAGIETVMITGDHLETAKAIAGQVGIEGPALEGRELDLVEGEARRALVAQTKVFARVSPEHKVEICRALGERGEVVAMTGDGVNDAPALRTAHVGVAMGQRGSDVAREAAAIVLADDHFATIVSAVREGRRIHDNIRRFVLFLLRSNFDELLLIAVAMMAGLPLPYLPVHILWINLLTDGLPALALATEAGEPDLMERPPRSPKEHLLSGEAGRLVGASLMCFAAVFALFFISLQRGVDLDTARSGALTLGICLELLLAFSARARVPVWVVGWGTNAWLVRAVVAVSVAHLALLYTPLGRLFHLRPLGWEWWAVILPIAFAAFFAFELVKGRAHTRRDASA